MKKNIVNRIEKVFVKGKYTMFGIILCNLYYPSFTLLSVIK